MLWIWRVKRFNIFIPKGRGTKGGWASMVETLRRLVCADRGMTSQKEEEPRSKPNMAKTFAEVTNMSRAKGDNLRSWRIQLAKIWSLKGNLGLAKMKRGKVLMEFELLIEAEQAIKLRSISVGGIFLRLEKWRPETGCLREGENKSEAWVRVVSLPVPLWERDILRKIGEECGRFLAVNCQTEKMEELQWARLLVEPNGEELPNVVKFWVEKMCYSITLWWEVRLVMRVATVGKRGKVVTTGEEVGGEACTRTSKRVLEAKEGSRLEALLLHVDGTQGGGGSSYFGKWSKPNEGPRRWYFPFWVKDGLRRLSEEETQSEGISKTDCALLEEVARYENASFSFGMVVSTPPFSPSSIYGRTPLGEYYDLSRATLDITQGVTHRLCNGSGSIEQEEGKCWELIEVNTDSIEESRETLCLPGLCHKKKEDGRKKRRERVHSKVLLEKSRFERELKGLNVPSIMRGEEEEEVCCARKRMPDYGSPMKIRLLSWNVRGANDSSKRKVIKGVTGGILICWDKRTLEVLEMEMGQFSISCRLKNVEDGNAWIFTGVGQFQCYPIPKGKEQSGEADWRHEKICSGASSGLVVGGGGRGRASFRLATKMKVLKEKIKGWNRDVFGRLEVNKNLALQQVEFWDGWRVKGA
ncbi:hypothetical protein CK203_084953 [Vitis vinifera]|uniref:DUF4283 domain-containing protein n=1 Tax=Vitis vinifera TaxID=29760 RepID=A0A438CXJ2_VITVI|nr:hypothetical protein CK203_084953 [Vitis vinifera]